MHIQTCQESLEPCTEAGWEAYDLTLNQPLTDQSIRSLRAFGGGFLYLSTLKHPFFKLESDTYLIKGICGQSSLRMAVHRDHKKELQRFQYYLEALQETNQTLAESMITS